MGCILSKFYIKPQRDNRHAMHRQVVSYRNSTSNHNPGTRRPAVAVVVSYRNSTSNHNRSLPVSWASAVVSYRNSTSNHNFYSHCFALVSLYLIEILHQTTTEQEITSQLNCCILSKFYIKPQPRFRWYCRSIRCILSKFYIKPQHGSIHERDRVVVSYRNSTSNHNPTPLSCLLQQLYLIEILHQTTTIYQRQIPQQKLYLIEILHQTTTFTRVPLLTSVLYLIEILHQTTTQRGVHIRQLGCILSKFYIKPQLSTSGLKLPLCCILSKFYIKPQQIVHIKFTAIVVSYRNSTSNHNPDVELSPSDFVVSYRNSTSNHNNWFY